MASQYATQADVQRLIADKVTHQQMLEALPNLDNFTERFQQQIQQVSEDLQEKLNVSQKGLDQRLIKFRNEFDFDAI